MASCRCCFWGAVGGRRRPQVWKSWRIRESDDSILRKAWCFYPQMCVRWFGGWLEVMTHGHVFWILHRMTSCWGLAEPCSVWMTLRFCIKPRWQTLLGVAGIIHLPGAAERVGWAGYTLLRNSPPVGCSGVLHSEEFLALSLLLLGSLSLIMSYWRQKSAITPGRRGRIKSRSAFWCE